MRSPLLFLSLLVCSSLAFSRPALAQDAAAAEALFRSAREAAEQGDWVTACDRFEESKRLEPAPGTVLNLARCREKLGQVASAWKSYNEAAQRLPARDERRAFARKKALELEARVPHLTLEAPRSEQSVAVFVAGTKLSSATFGVPLPFDPGDVEIVVQAEGHETNSTVLNLEEGQVVSHQIVLGPLLPSAPDAGPSDRRATVATSAKTDGSGAQPFFILGGVGAAAAVFGGVWAGIELPKVKDEANCVDGTCVDAGADAAARGRAAVYLLGAGSLLAIGGFSVGAYLSTKKKEHQVSLVPLPGGGAVLWKADL